MSSGLRARTVPLEEAPDPVAVAGGDGLLWEGDGTALAGVGVARRFEVDRADPAAAAARVSTELATIESAPGGGAPRTPVDGTDDSPAAPLAERPGTGPVALGAWPFAPDVPGELVVPEALVGRSEDGTAWVTTVLDAEAGDADHDEVARRLLERAERGADTTSLAGFASTEPFGPSSFKLRSARSPEAWCDAVAAARDELRAGAADKVVLAREVVVAADEALDVAGVLRRLRSAFPASLRFSIEGFVGASPELLVARHGEVVACHPMAGTAPRRGDPEADARLAEALRSSSKNAVEHRHTIDLVHEALLPYCSYLDEEAEPSVVALANVQHLATRLEGRLSSPPASIVELVCVLHPTPAVCGRPRAAALKLIERYEELDRGRYAGPVGWVDHRGNGSWAVGIRCAEVDGPVARVFAGVGVVADSDPRVELAETRAKLQALLTPLLRP